MNIQIKKEEIEVAKGLAMDLGPFRRALALVASGLTVEEGQARLDREALRREGDVAARRRAKLDRVRIRTLNDGQTLAAPTKAQAKSLKEADALEAAARAVLDRGADAATPAERRAKRASAAERKAARADMGKAFGLRHKVEAERMAALAKRQDGLRLGEAEALDALRADEGAPVVERERGQVGRRLRERDGLKLLHERGAFRPRSDEGEMRRDLAARLESDRLLAIGLRFRDRYEMAAASLRSSLPDGEQSGAVRSGFLEARYTQRRMALIQNVREWEAMVSVQIGADGLNALRLVAGEGRSIASITTSARRRDRMAKALTAALKLLVDRVSRDA
ncbi:MAG: hypothetical protein ACT6RD_03405 [Brevundimonas sp.]|uniref:hypothetical protein n=1 Tax=Brevundimonas sp. TaxID=1871086 RepID=UPI0040345DDA